MGENRCSVRVLDEVVEERVDLPPEVPRRRAVEQWDEVRRVPKRKARDVDRRDLVEEHDGGELDHSAYYLWLNKKATP